MTDRMTTPEMGMPAIDPRSLIADAPMSRLQIVAVVLAIALNALDGFDVLSISFAAPGIATEFGIDPTALGLVLSMELIGMAAGSVLLGMLADRVGRRPVMLGCLVVMATGMALASTAASLGPLTAYRLFTGIGIGGMLATTNAVVAEFSNRRRRNLAIAIMGGGYPVGAVVGGAIASVLLTSGHSWQAIFHLGALATACFIPLVLHIMTFYFFVKWVPKLVVDMGYTQGQASSVLVWANVGGASGSLFISLLTQKLPVRWLSMGAMLLGAAFVVYFGQPHGSLNDLAIVAGIAGFFLNGATVGLYFMFAQSYPTSLRATGTGLIIGIGRGGAALGPILAGVLLQSGMSVPVVAIFLAFGSLFAAGALLLLRYREEWQL
jgi:MFS family permease